jgi:hypothetical protein
MKLDYAIIGFLLVVARITIYGASIGEAIALFALGSLCGFRHWLSQQKIRDRNEEFEGAVKKEFEKVAVELNSLRNAVGTLNLGNAYKQPAIRPLNGQLKR